MENNSRKVEQNNQSPFIFLYKFKKKFLYLINKGWSSFLFELKRRIYLIYHPKPKVFTRLNQANQKVVYTVILGNYDDLKEPEVFSDKWDYICFTDRDDLHSEIWQIVKIKNPSSLNSKRSSSFFTIFPFRYLKQYELSILIGGQISIHCDLNEFIRDNLPPGRSIAISRHPVRNCIYDEAQKVIEIKKDSVTTVMRQMRKYKREGFPQNYGLVQGGLMIRRHNDEKLIRHCRLWLREIKRHSRREQLSFNYILWKYRLIEPEMLSPGVLSSSFMIHKHNYRQQFTK